MDIAFREDSPIYLYHLCAGTEIGTTAQDGITEDKAGIKILKEELDNPERERDDHDINTDIAALEADLAVHQSNFDTELAKVKKASDYLSYILVHSTKTASEPNHYIRVVFINKKMVLKLGGCSGSATAGAIDWAPIHSCRTS